MTSIPNQLIININTSIPGFQKIKYKPSMSIENLGENDKSVIFNPLTKLDEKKILENKENNKRNFFSRGLFEMMLAQIKAPRAVNLAQATRLGYVDNNIKVTLNTIFADNSVITIGGKPYTIVDVQWSNGDWKIDAKRKFMPTLDPSKVTDPATYLSLIKDEIAAGENELKGLPENTIYGPNYVGPKNIIVSGPSGETLPVKTTATLPTQAPQKEVTTKEVTTKELATKEKPTKVGIPKGSIIVLKSGFIINVKPQTILALFNGKTIPAFTPGLILPLNDNYFLYNSENEIISGSILTSASLIIPDYTDLSVPSNFTFTILKLLNIGEYMLIKSNPVIISLNDDSPTIAPVNIIFKLPPGVQQLTYDKDTNIVCIYELNNSTLAVPRGLDIPEIHCGIILKNSTGLHLYNDGIIDNRLQDSRYYVFIKIFECREMLALGAPGPLGLPQGPLGLPQGPLGLQGPIKAIEKYISLKPGDIFEKGGIEMKVNGYGKITLPLDYDENNPDFVFKKDVPYKVITDHGSIEEVFDEDATFIPKKIKSNEPVVSFPKDDDEFDYDYDDDIDEITKDDDEQEEEEEEVNKPTFFVKPKLKHNDILKRRAFITLFKNTYEFINLILKKDPEFLNRMNAYLKQVTNVDIKLNSQNLSIAAYNKSIETTDKRGSIIGSQSFNIIPNAGGGNCFFIAMADSINNHNQQFPHDFIDIHIGTNSRITDIIVTQTQIRNIVYEYFRDLSMDSKQIHFDMAQELADNLNAVFADLHTRVIARGQDFDYNTELNNIYTSFNYELMDGKNLELGNFLVKKVDVVPEKEDPNYLMPFTSIDPDNEDDIQSYFLSASYWGDQFSFVALMNKLRLNIIPVGYIGDLKTGKYKFYYETSGINFLEDTENLWDKYLFLLYDKDGKHYEAISFPISVTDMTIPMTSRSVTNVVTKSIFNKNELPPLYIIIYIFVIFYYHHVDDWSFLEDTLVFYSNAYEKIEESSDRNILFRSFIKIFDKNFIPVGNEDYRIYAAVMTLPKKEEPKKQSIFNATPGNVSPRRSARITSKKYDRDSDLPGLKTKKTKDKSGRTHIRFFDDDFSLFGGEKDEKNEQTIILKQTPVEQMLKPKDSSQLAYNITIDMELYAGSSIPPEELGKIHCKKKWNSVRKAYSELLGKPYIIPPVHQPMQNDNNNNTNNNNTNNDTNNNDTKKNIQKTNNTTRKNKVV